MNTKKPAAWPSSRQAARKCRQGPGTWRRRLGRNMLRGLLSSVGDGGRQSCPPRSTYISPGLVSGRGLLQSAERRPPRDELSRCELDWKVDISLSPRLGGNNKHSLSVAESTLKKKTKKNRGDCVFTALLWRCWILAAFMCLHFWNCGKINQIRANLKLI